MHPGGRATYGNSLIVDPWGEVSARRPEGTGPVLASLSSTWQAELRQTFPVLQHRQ